MGNLKKVKNQYICMLAITLSENYCIPYSEAKEAIRLSQFNDDIERYNEDELQTLTGRNANKIVNDIWNDYKDLCLV